MTSAAASFEILTEYEFTKPFLDSVRASSDAHRNSFGFLAASIYKEFARNNCLYVLVDSSNREYRYCGHLLFTQRYPSARVVQMFTCSQYRRNGLAKRLLDHFKDELTSAGFTSIYASVAEDLVEANAFWERQQFHIQTVKEGGQTRKRKILRRCHELKSPQLVPVSGINTHNPLGLTSTVTGRDSLFLLDLNVLFDLSGPRRVRHAEAVSLFQVERMNLCKLAVSNESREELRRTATPGKLDPMEGLIDILPSFPLKKFELGECVFEQLSTIVFPHKAILSANDKSDLCHIATAIQHGLTGLITNDETVLEAGPKVKSGFGVEILSPTAFLLKDVSGQDSIFEGANNAHLTLRVIDDSQFAVVHSFLGNQGISSSSIASNWLATGANARVAPRFGVWENEVLVGYLTWATTAIDATIVARVAVNGASDFAVDASRIMLTYLLEQLPQQGPRKIELEIPSFQPRVREIAIALGFRGIPEQGGLHKIILGGVLTKESWGDYRSQLLKNSNVKLPDTIPAYQHPDQQVPIIAPDGNRRFIALDELESLLSPTLFCLPGRPAVITPIQRSFAEPLLGHSVQESLLPSNRASLFHDRHYISARKNLSHFKRGALILFYESGRGRGRCAVVAIARVRRAYLKQCEDLGSSDLEQSVLTSASIGSVGKTNTKTVTVFDNIFVLPRPVALASLRRIGCGSETQLISTNPISNTQLQEILHEAFCHGH